MHKLFFPKITLTLTCDLFLVMLCISVIFKCPSNVCRYTLAITSHGLCLSLLTIKMVYTILEKILSRSPRDILIRAHYQMCPHQGVPLYYQKSTGTILFDKPFLELWRIRAIPSGAPTVEHIRKLMTNIQQHQRTGERKIHTCVLAATTLFH